VEYEWNKSDSAHLWLTHSLTKNTLGVYELQLRTLFISSLVPE